MLLLSFQSLLSCSHFYTALENAIEAGALQKRLLAGHPFQHTVFYNQAALRQATIEFKAGQPLHIYIGGDGTPWINGRYIAEDPTPRNPIALKMFLLDSQPAAFVGRPCYFEQPKNDDCDAQLWTSGRYSETVVASMSSVIRRIQAELKASQLILIGYSGGGTIATLVANQIETVSALVTVAANLDTDAWTHHHGYLPLEHSINPLSLKPLRKNLAVLHFVAEHDKVVPPMLSQAFVDKHGGVIHILNDFDHACCWHQQWPTLLDEIKSFADTAVNRKKN